MGKRTTTLENHKKGCSENFKNIADELRLLKSIKSNSANMSLNDSISSPRNVQPVNINIDTTKQSLHQTKSTLKHPNITYAQALAASKIQSNAIRNWIMGEPEEAAATAKALKRDHNFATANIREVSQKGTFNLTVKCKTLEDAEKMEVDLIKKYANKITVTPPKQYPPMVKITNMIVEDNDVKNIEATIRQANFWTNDLEFQIIDVHSVLTRNGEYTNIVVACDIATQNFFLDKQNLVYGFSSCRIHEHINHHHQCSMQAMSKVWSLRAELFIQAKLSTMWRRTQVGRLFSD